MDSSGDSLSNRVQGASSESITFASLFPRNNSESNNNTGCYSMVVASTTSSSASFSPQECYHAILKISNISWDTSTADIAEFLAGAAVAIRPHQIHIPIDRVTGKTRSDMYIEMSSVEDILRIMHQMNRRILKGRSLCMTMASFDELYKVHFNDPEDASGLGVSKSEATSLINICRNYKIYFSRKCAERPFEHVVSLLRLAEWWRLRPSGRDRLFQIAVTSVEALLSHLSRPFCQISTELFQRLVDAAKQFPAFTPGQQGQIEKFLKENKVEVPQEDEQSSKENLIFDHCSPDNEASIFESIFRAN